MSAPVLTLDQLPDALTAGEAASVLRIGRSTVYEMIRRNELESIHIGRRVLVPKRVVAKMLGVGGDSKI